MYTPDALVKLAVQEIVTNINGGLSPQDATVKVAKELCLNHNFIKRSSEAINVALHHNHFKQNPDARADDFETVDAQKVAETIYGVKEKTASAYRSELFSSFQYPEETPKFARYLEEGQHKEVYEKIASEGDTALVKNATSEPGIINKGSNYIRKLKKQAYEAEAAALDSKTEVEKSFCDILRKFAQDINTRCEWHQFETAVFSKYGSSSEGYLDLLYKTAKLNEERGAHDVNIKLSADCAELALYDRFVDNLRKFAELGVASDDAVYNLNFEQSYAKEAFDKRGCELNKEAEYDATSLLERVEQSLAAERSKSAAVNEAEDPVMAAVAQKRAENADASEERIKAASSLFELGMGAAKDIAKPSLSASTNTPDNNRHRALLLQELVTTDPIISKFPVHQTVDAYQQLLRIAPELSTEREITRAFLRQAGASQAIDPFQAEQLIDANNKLFKGHQLQKGLIDK